MYLFYLLFASLFLLVTSYSACKDHFDSYGVVFLKSHKKQLLEQIYLTSKPVATKVLPTFFPNKETLEYTISVLRVNNKPVYHMDLSEYDMSIVQMDFLEMKNTNKINVSKMNNQLVYTSLLKLERIKNQLENQIDKLKKDVANEKAQRKETKNKCKDL